jgi:hypothetical protein
MDGGWWPQSRDLPVELAELIDQLPPHLGRVVRALYSAPDWDPTPRRVQTSHGKVELTGRRHRDHMLCLESSAGEVVEILVVPPGMSAAQGEEALLASATPGNTASATSLLKTVTEFADVDPADLWRDDGGSWWHPHPTAPSFRTEP